MAQGSKPGGGARARRAKRRPGAQAQRSRPAPAAARGLSRRQHLLLGLVFGAALLLRGAYLRGQARNNPLFDAPIMDGQVHHQWASRIAAGAGLGPKPYFRAPLYYYWLAGLYRVFGAEPAVGRLAGGLLGALSCYLIGWLGVVLGGLRTGLVAGLLAAFYWPFIYFEAELLSVGLEVLLGTGLLLLLLAAARRGTGRLFLAAGLVWGLAAITRPTVLGFVPGFLLWLWLVTPQPQRRRRWAGRAALSGLGGALALLPVSVRNYVVGHELVLIATNGGVNFYIGNNPRANGYTAIVPGTRPGWWGGYEDTHRIAARELGHTPSEGEVSRYWAQQAWGWIRSDPGRWLGLMWRKFRLFWSPLEVPNNQPIRFFAELAPLAALFWIGFPAAACLGLAGLVFPRRQWRSWLVLVLFLASYMVTVIMFFCNGRYRLPIVPALLVSGAYGAVRLTEALRARRLGRPAAAVLLGAVVGAFLASNPPEDRAAFRRGADGEAHYILGNHYLDAAQPELARAIAHFQAAIARRPNDPDYRERIALALLRAGRVEQARTHLRWLRERHPGAPNKWLRDARRYFRGGRPQEALRRLRLALLAEPGHVPARVQIVALLTGQRRFAEAIAEARQGVRLNPRQPTLMVLLAWLLATVPDGELRDGAEALRLAEQASRLPGAPRFEPLDTLAAAYAESGQFDRAVAAARQAEALARRAGRTQRAARIAQRRRLYEQQRPFREPAAR